MNIDYGKRKTEYGPGVQIVLSGDEIATAIDAYLVSQGVHVNGPRTIRVNGQLCDLGEVYVDPSGFVISQGQKFSGSGSSLKEQALEQQPISPSPELVKKIKDTALLDSTNQFDYEMQLINFAYRAGADYQLEECIEWMVKMGCWGEDGKAIPMLRSAMRPKPPSLKQQAQRILVENGTTLDGRMELEPEDIEILSAALKLLPDEEV